ncbi:MAG: hypothetical protein HWD61_02340 [Parachlamydiaceae bacterium]|nr:MAG: hypothetical protein HWD61_02340 [Parachlamydiaceae bacterium]
MPVGIARLIGKVINHYSTKFGFVQGVTIKRETCDFYREAYTHDRRFKRIAIETADHVKLDTGMVENPKQMKELVQNRKYIIFFNGNAGTYEGMMSTLINISEKTGANVYCGNYRGLDIAKGFRLAFRT